MNLNYSFETQAMTKKKVDNQIHNLIFNNSYL